MLHTFLQVKKQTLEETLLPKTAISAATEKAGVTVQLQGT